MVRGEMPRGFIEQAPGLLHEHLLAEQHLMLVLASMTNGQPDTTPFSTVLGVDRSCSMIEERSMRIYSSSLALPVLGIIAILAACTTSQSNRPSAMTQNSSPVSQPVVSDRQASGNQSIRSVDFANFSFPWLRELGDSKQTFTLRSGELKPSRDENRMVKEMGVTLQSIVYGDVTGDGEEEAMVVLSMVTGGSAIPHATYIYRSENGRPTLVWAFSTGDRAEGGLRRVYSDKGELVIERYSPVNSKGACCPTLFTRTYYKWQHKQFDQSGKEEALPNSEEHGSPLMEPYNP